MLDRGLIQRAVSVGRWAAVTLMEGRKQVYMSAWLTVTCADECAYEPRGTHTATCLFVWVLMSVLHECVCIFMFTNTYVDIIRARTWISLTGTEETFMCQKWAAHTILRLIRSKLTLQKSLSLRSVLYTSLQAGKDDLNEHNCFSSLIFLLNRGNYWAEAAIKDYRH